MEHDELADAANRVRALLKEARAIAWEAFDPPSEDTVIAVFQRLCLEADSAPGPMPDDPAGGRVLH